MSILTNNDAAIRARNLLTERGEANANLTLPRIIALIPQALEPWTRACHADKEKRELLRQQVEASVDSGTCDLLDFLDGSDAVISLKDLKETTIYEDTTAYGEIGKPLTWVGSLNQLAHTRPFGSDSIACFLDGTTLRTRSGTALNASFDIVFTVPIFPQTVADIPLPLQMDFISYLALTAARELAAGENIAAAREAKN